MQTASDIPGIGSENSARIASILANTHQIEVAILYGSRAMGNFKPASDIDLTLKGSQLTYDTLLRISQQLDDLLLPWEMDISLYTQIDNLDLIDHIDRVGKVIYCHD